MTAPTRRRVLPAGPRLAERARARRAGRRRPLRRGWFAALAVMASCLLSWLLLSSPLLSVHRVEVVGASALSPDTVRAVAAVPAGTPLARVDTSAARGRVAALAPVARVRVVRAWPTTIRLRVIERIPVATMRQSDGTWALLDAGGTRFSPSPDRPGGLPELQVATEQAVGSAVQVLGELPSALRDQVSSVHAATPSSVVLALADGHAVVWGAPGGAARKAAVVAALLPRPGKTLDVTSPGVAVIR